MSWMRCSACKRDIAFGALHWVCSVSTCNRHNTNYKFCTVACWDSHVATLRHRDAWAVEARAPSRDTYERERDLTATVELKPMTSARPAPAPAPVVRTSAPAPAAPSSAAPAAAPITLAEAEDEVLIVVSKMKKYIRERSGMNTSDAVADELSEHVRAICDAAIRTAAADGRKTVLDRDVPRVKR